MKRFWLAAVIAVAAAGMAQAKDASAPAEARIPFVKHGGIRDWQADGSRAIYVQDSHRQWYRATFMGSCIDLPFAEVVGFETRGNDIFDRFGTVLVRDQRCAVSSFVKSSAPPEKADRKKRRIQQVKPAKPAS